jgi:hypothetical protein
MAAVHAKMEWAREVLRRLEARDDIKATFAKAEAD